MGEKKTDKNDAEKNNDGKKEGSPNTVVLKVDMHCDGCASKIIKSVRGFQGVESVKAERDANKLTVVGKLEPSKLRDKLALKTKKKVELVSPHPQPKKENKESKADNNKKSDDKSKKKADGDDKKLKEPPVTTAVLKVELHCQGCIDKIRQTVSKAKGVHDMSMDKEKETITVKGTMDAKALANNLHDKLKRRVEVVPPKKEKEKDKEGGAEKEGGDNGGGKKKKGGRGDNNEDSGGDGGGKLDKMEYFPAQSFGFGYGYGYGYGPVYMEQVHAPQLFSDENPNACFVM